MNAKRLVLIGVAMLLMLGAGAGGAWWYFGKAAKAGEGKSGEAPHAESKDPAPDYKYVSLDKVLVMLRGTNGAAVSHYMAVDIVFKTLPDQEKRTKEHLPLLRTVAVKALSAYTVESASAMKVEDVAVQLNEAYRDSYRADRHEQPFAEALIGKLIIE